MTTHIQARYLNLYEVAGGAESANSIRNVHLINKPGLYKIEATNGNMTLIIEGRHYPEDSFLTEPDTLLSPGDIKSILAKANGGQVSLATERVEDGAGSERRETTITTNDGTSIKIHSVGDKYPELDGWVDRENLRPRIPVTLNRVNAVKLLKVFARHSESDEFTMSFPIDGSSSSIKFTSENGDGVFLQGFLCPIVEELVSPVEQYATMLEAVNARSDSLLGQIEDKEIVAQIKKVKIECQKMVDLVELNKDSLAEREQITPYSVMIDTVEQANAEANIVGEDGDGDEGDGVETPDMLGDEEGEL